jgi:hypothetical protein
VQLAQPEQTEQMVSKVELEQLDQTAIQVSKEVPVQLAVVELAVTKEQQEQPVREDSKEQQVIKAQVVSKVQLEIKV